MDLIYPNFWSHIFEIRYTYVDNNYISTIIILIINIIINITNNHSVAS